MTNDTNVVGVRHNKQTNTYTAVIEYRTGAHKCKHKQKTFPTLEEAIAQRKQWENDRDKYYRSVGKWRFVKTKTDPTKLCTDNCADCIYSEKMECKSNELCCLYILMTGHKRPCKAGDSCIVKVVRSKDHNKLKMMYYIDSFVVSNYRGRKQRVSKSLKKLT